MSSTSATSIWWLSCGRYFSGIDPLTAVLWSCGPGHFISGGHCCPRACSNRPGTRYARDDRCSGSSWAGSRPSAFGVNQYRPCLFKAVGRRSMAAVFLRGLSKDSVLPKVGAVSKPDARPVVLWGLARADLAFTELRNARGYSVRCR